jgi:hypothetical protein
MGSLLSVKVELYSEYWSSREGKSEVVARKNKSLKHKKQICSEKMRPLPEKAGLIQ